MSLMTTGTNNYFWLPKQASEIAPEIDFLFNAILTISLVAFVGIVVAMLLFCIWYRRRDGYVPQPSPSHSTSLELIWTIVPSIFLIWIFARGVYGFQKMKMNDIDAPEINVVAKQFGWEFVYPNGEVTDVLHLSRNQPVRLKMTSIDVIHSFYVPAFRVKMDVMPKRYHELVFKPTVTSTEENPFILKCAEFCGENHSEMKKSVIVHEEPWGEMLRKYVRWKKEEYSDLDNGKRLYKIHCNGCHTTDGSIMTGPSFKDFLSRPHEFSNDSKVLNFNDKATVAFDDYFKESLEEPETKLVKGFPNQMTSFKGKFSEAEYRYLKAFMVEASAGRMTKEALDAKAEKIKPAAKDADDKKDDGSKKDPVGDSKKDEPKKSEPKAKESSEKNEAKK